MANIVGANMRNYKIIRKNQFACSIMQVRRDGKMPVALLQKFDEAIISQAYPVFEVKDENKLLPEYLMMWFSRPEFDREACFYAVGGVRGSLEWEDFCNMKLPVPSIETQRAIVEEYNTVKNRIALNNQLIQKLEETAQAIYKQWFVDFEFPDENGKPYKSSGGKMVFNEELEKEIPEGWEVNELENVLEEIISHRGKSKALMDLYDIKRGENIFPVISAMNVNNGRIVKKESIKYTNANNYENWMIDPLLQGDLIMTSEAPMGELLYLANYSDFIISQRLFALRANKQKISSLLLYYWLKGADAKGDMEGRASGTTVLGIKLTELRKVIVLVPKTMLQSDFESLIYPMRNFIEIIMDEINLLEEKLNLLLSKVAIIEN
ncbi:restriction endonuclease subunit S [Marinilabilia sp.]|uniref:restriction endonuclease subunit S n=1 Tax=Marinilabilia sp. TaxID=2021252 RepID=UPI0025B86AD1|nr:restriction endonuclease subunit S [Marinilabilia sp.]